MAAKKKLRRSVFNTCFSDCIARYLGVQYWKVPFFIEHDDFVRRAQRYFRRRGLILEPVPYKKTLLANKRKLYIVQGITPRSKTNKATNANGHCVLYRGTKPYWDPAGRTHPWLKRKTFVWTVRRVHKRVRLTSRKVVS